MSSAFVHSTGLREPTTVVREDCVPCESADLFEEEVGLGSVGLHRTAKLQLEDMLLRLRRQVVRRRWVKHAEGLVSANTKLCLSPSLPCRCFSEALAPSDLYESSTDSSIESSTTQSLISVGPVVSPVSASVNESSMSLPKDPPVQPITAEPMTPVTPVDRSETLR